MYAAWAIPLIIVFMQQDHAFGRILTTFFKNILQFVQDMVIIMLFSLKPTIRTHSSAKTINFSSIDRPWIGLVVFLLFVSDPSTFLWQKIILKTLSNISYNNCLPHIHKIFSRVLQKESTTFNITLLNCWQMFGYIPCTNVINFWTIFFIFLSSVKD